MKTAVNFKRWEETLMDAVHGAMGLGSALSNNISTEEKNKRNRMQENEPTNSQATSILRQPDWNQSLGDTITISRTPPWMKRVSMGIRSKMLSSMKASTRIKMKEQIQLGRECRNQKFNSRKTESVTIKSKLLQLLQDSQDGKKQQLTPSIRGRLANEAIVCYHHARIWRLNSVSSMRASDNSG